MFKTILGIIGIVNTSITFNYYGHEPMWMTGATLGAALYSFAYIASIKD